MAIPSPLALSERLLSSLRTNLESSITGLGIRQMIDTITYGLTKDLPAGPIYRPADPMPHELFVCDVDDGSLTRGRIIGGVISLVLLAATGAYLFLTL